MPVPPILALHHAPAVVEAAVSLAVRGPATAIAVLLSTAKFSLGAFCVTLRNAILDCSTDAGDKAACGVDILEAVVSGLVGIGAAAGATYIGLVSPTPRDLALASTSEPIFRVDGMNVSWTHGMQTHSLYGLNRTYSDPAVVEFQLDHSDRTRRYLAYEKDGYLMTRHDTGVDVPVSAVSKNPSPNKKGDCRAYWNLAIASDTLRNADYASLPTYSELYAISNSIFNYYYSNDVDSGCVNLGLNDGIAGASFQLGASCDYDDPYPTGCGGVDYDIPLYETSI